MDRITGPAPLLHATARKKFEVEVIGQRSGREGEGRVEGGQRLRKRRQQRNGIDSGRVGERRRLR